MLLTLKDVTEVTLPNLEWLLVSNIQRRRISICMSFLWEPVYLVLDGFDIAFDKTNSVLCDKIKIHNGIRRSQKHLKGLRESKLSGIHSNQSVWRRSHHNAYFGLTCALLDGLGLLDAIYGGVCDREILREFGINVSVEMLMFKWFWSISSKPIKATLDKTFHY